MEKTRNVYGLLTAFAGNNGGLCANRAPLSFSNVCDNNNSGGSNQVGKSGINSGTAGRELLDYWVNNRTGSGASIGGSSITLNDPNLGAKQESATGANIRYLSATSATTTINASTIPQGTTFLFDAEGKNITIAGNVKYQDGYRSLSQIPKLIIYANNINIHCGVGEIDAILIATSNVNTCSDPGDSGNVNTQNRSKQLKIVGVVIAGHVDLGRTYGQAAWNGTGANGQQQAAEIFDYDSTVLMWSEYMSGSAETDTLQSVYQHELAPRY